jgi:class 3 adenylate cyclase
LVASTSPIRYAHNGDVSIAYTEAGNGMDVLVIGGFVSHLEVFPTLPAAGRFIDRLGSFSRAILFDKRGMGLSDRDAGAYTLENVVDDALAVLDDLDVPHAAVLGISEGGSAATMLAAAHPERVSAMVQYATYARLAQAADFPEGIPPERLRAFWNMIESDWADPKSIDFWSPSRAGDPELRDWWGRLLRSGLNPGGARKLVEMYLDLDVRPLLASIRTPSLVLYREGDKIVPARLSQGVARGIPDAREVELAGGDHLFCTGDQDGLLDEIERFLTGDLARRPVDRVLATVLFTDIVGSTERAAELGDRRWRDVLERHDRLVKEEVGRHRGRVVKSTGDGVLATFDGPGRAVRAGMALRTAAPETLGSELRVGVHTGECELIGDDLGGIGVHIAARIQADADPGQVLVSSTVKDLVVGSGLRFGEQRDRTLKGVPDIWRLFPVIGDEEAEASAA